jgi:hypothetical protein
MADFKLESIEASASGLDAFFEREPAVITPPGQPVPKTAATKGRMKVASLADLSGFVRASADTLVHKSTKELWALRQDGKNYFVERLFNDAGSPLKD